MARSREQQREDVTMAVLKAAHGLFSDKGYKDTTIGDISKAADLHVGSIYNIFRDKEDIVCELLLTDYSLTMAKAETFTDEDDDIIPLIGFPMAVQLTLAETDPNIARTFCSYYTSAKIMRCLSEMQYGRVVRYFGKYGRTLNKGWMMRRIYAVNGVIGSLVSEVCENGGDVRENLRLGIELFCAAFNTPCFDPEHMTDRALELVAENPPGSFLISR